MHTGCASVTSEQEWISLVTAKEIAVFTFAAGLMTIINRRLPAERQFTGATRGIAKALLNRAFHIIVSNFPKNSIRLPKQTIIAYTKSSLSETHNVKRKFEKILQQKPARGSTIRVPAYRAATFQNTSTRSMLRRWYTRNATKAEPKQGLKILPSATKKTS